VACRECRQRRSVVNIVWRRQVRSRSRITKIYHLCPPLSGRKVQYHTKRYKLERPYTSASNRVRRISEGRSAAKAKWEADKCSKHFSYRLKGKAVTKRPVPMTSVKSLAARFYRLKSGHAPTGVYLKRFGHRDDDKCWWGGGTVSQTREHLFRHCSRWKDQ